MRLFLRCFLIISILGVFVISVLTLNDDCGLPWDASMYLDKLISQSFLIGVTHYGNGNVYSGKIARPFNFRYRRYILPLAMSSEINFFENGGLEFCTLSEDTLVQVGKNKILLKEGTRCTFYENGIINYATLATNQFGIVGKNRIVLSNCMPRMWPWANITFYENGNLKEAFAGKNSNIVVLNNKAFFEENSPLCFYNNEILSHGELDRPLHITLHGYQLVIEGQLELYPNGMPKCANSVNPINICVNKQNISVYTRSFYEGGEIMDCFAHKRQRITINGIPFELEAEHISFYQNGRLKSCIITEECYKKTKVTAEMRCDWGCEVFFDESGNIVDSNETSSQTKELNVGTISTSQEKI